MLLQNKIERAFKLQSRKNAERTGMTSEMQMKEYDPKTDIERPPLKDMMEKGDVFAMLIAGFITFIPAALIVMVVMVLLARLFFGI